MAQKVTFKFLTLNLCHGGLLMDQLTEFLRVQVPDIMVFQEVNSARVSMAAPHFQSNSHLQRLFPSYFLAYDPGVAINYLKENLLVEQGNSTLSRYPIREHQLVYFASHYAQFDSPQPGEKPDYRIFPKFMQLSSLTLPNKKDLLVINLHGVWDFHGDDTPTRLAMTKTILDHAKSSKYVIIAGDSNARYQSQTIRQLMKSYPSVLTPAPVSTFNMTQKSDPGYAQAAVDILLTSPNIQVLESSLPQVDISDHYPIVATLSL